MVQHLLVSKSEYPNAFGARLLVITQLNISVWEFYLQSYQDAHVVDFVRFGWPMSYTAENLPTSSLLISPTMWNTILTLNLLALSAQILYISL